MDSAKGKISSIEEEKKKTEQAIKELETLKADTETYVRKLDSQLETLNAEVNRLEGNIRDKEKTIEETAVKLDEAGKVEKKQYEAMKSVSNTCTRRVTAVTWIFFCSRSPCRSF